MVKKPTFKIVVNSKNITPKISPYLSEISLTDNDKNQADELTLSLSAKFKRPNYQDEIKIYLGYAGEKLKFAGLFFVQQTCVKNNNKLTITATGVDFNTSFKERRNASYFSVTLSKLAQTIAQRNGLLNNVDDFKQFISVQQKNESDMNLLARLAKEYNIIFNIKNKTLYFKDEFDKVPEISVDIDNCFDSIINHSNKTLYKSCAVIYHDTKQNKQITVEIKAGDGKPAIKKSGKFSNKKDALIFAKNTLIKANKAEVAGNLTMLGKVVFAGSNLNLGDKTYRVYRVKHTINKSWTTTLEFESHKKNTS